MVRIRGNGIEETAYEVADEAKNASLFGIGNGYFGIRGSFEEFGDVGVQGCYVRGVFGSVVEDPHARSANIYMKRYYFDEQKLKEFEYEDCCVNIADFTAIRVFVGGEELRPWTAKIVSWDRRLDYKDGSLQRTVVYEDPSGRRTRLTFYKAASFADDHLIIQSLKIEKLNHDADVEVRSGVDALVKTEGQKISKVTSSEMKDGNLGLKFSFGDKYGMGGRSLTVSRLEGGSLNGMGEEHGFYFASFKLAKRVGTIMKTTRFLASIDSDYDQKDIDVIDFDEALKRHREAYASVWRLADMKIKGNSRFDALLRYANFQTIIGANRNDAVHSLSAKNLTSERYNQFVWWDAEIFQRPYFDNLIPSVSRNALIYRIDRLEEAKANAAKEGREGARYAFCSSVKGDENVWPYARHAGMQIHVNADIAYGFISYVKATGDYSILKEGGFEVLKQVMLYFMSRSSFRDGAFHLDCVTGTDEHHDYVNDDAYTNYLVRFDGGELLGFAERLGWPLDHAFEKRLRDYLSELYLPGFDERGVLPQFDGYFDLKPYLPGKKEGGHPGFQLAQDGLYHLSQIIKQPDVLMLYSYLDVGVSEHLKENYRFYVKRCEASSSLTYPVHGICAAKLGDQKGLADDFVESCLMDFEDIYGGAAQGLHAGALAGARLIITRGIAGLRNAYDALEANPQWYGSFGDIAFRYVYHGTLLDCLLSKEGLLIKPHGPVDIRSAGAIRHLEAGESTLIPGRAHRKPIRR
jgi:trehalose/maltose hydrolase-like predicted phosphorylase